MNKIHIASKSGKRAEYEEDQIKAMWQQGLIQGEDLYYWMRGMTDWKPLAEYFSAFEIKPVVPPPINPNLITKYVYLKDPKSLTSFLVTMLWISLGIEVISIFSDFGEILLLTKRSFTEAEAIANDTRQGLIAIVYLIVFLITGVTFLKWIYRANANSRGFGAKNMKFTPAWSIGYYFIPILVLYKPYNAMKEIWQVSGDPENWQMQEGSPLLGWWWALWLISNFFEYTSFRLSVNTEQIDTIIFSTALSIFGSIFAVPLCIVSINMIKAIVQRQELLTN